MNYSLPLKRTYGSDEIIAAAVRVFEELPSWSNHKRSCFGPHETERITIVGDDGRINYVERKYECYSVSCPIVIMHFASVLLTLHLYLRKPSGMESFDVSEHDEIMFTYGYTTPPVPTDHEAIRTVAKTQVEEFLIRLMKALD